MNNTVANTAIAVITVQGMKPTASMLLRRVRRRSARLLVTTTIADSTAIAVQKWLLQ